VSSSTIKKAIKTCAAILAMCLLTVIGGCGEEAPVSTNNTGEITDVLEAQAGRILKESLSSNNPRVRANAIEAAASIPGREGRNFMPEVMRLLTDNFVHVRFAAAVAVGDTRYTPAKDRIIQLLNDSDENVQLAAVYALRKLDPRTSIRRIIEGLKSPDMKVRANAVFLAGKTGDNKAIPFLYEALRDESSDDKVRLNCIEGIARLGDERIYQKIWALLISAYADDRILGVQAMGALGSQQAKDALATMLTDDVPEIRLVAAEQLGRVGDTSGEKAVLDALTQTTGGTDAESRERINMLAALAIGQIHTEALEKFLPELLKNESQFVRIAAAEAVYQGIK
jgi:HEAT repeat protein